MVAMSTASSPVEDAHRAIHANPSQPVPAILSRLQPPPIETIPHLSSADARPGHWVRYTGLVQDVWDTEIFMATCSTGQSALLVEQLAANNLPDDDSVKLAERLPVYIVSIPGQTDWSLGITSPNLPAPSSTAASTSTAAPSTSGAKKKRTRDDVDDGDDHDAKNTNGNATISNTPQNNPAPMTAARPPPIPRPGDASATEKRSRPTAALSVPSSPAMSSSPATLGLNTPDCGSGRLSSAVVAKLYTAPASAAEGATATDTTPKLNSVVQVVGILQDCHEAPRGSAATADAAKGMLSPEEFEFENEKIARNPTNVKRLHVVQWRLVPSYEANPGLLAQLHVPGAPSITAAQQEVRSLMSSSDSGLRDALVSRLGDVLYGDRLAAEYLLMCLLARRVETDSNQQVLGRLSVNLILPSGDSAANENIVRAIKYLCTKVVRVDVNILSMNCRDVYAKKDYELNRLKAGRLQIAEKSVLILDECSLQNGQLSERGVKNIKALKQVCSTGYAPLDFHYYQSNLFVDCSTLLLSRSSKSIIGGDVHIRIKPADDAPDRTKLQIRNLWSADELQRIRAAFSLLCHVEADADKEFVIEDETSNAIAQFYVEQRQQGRAKDGQDQLSVWLNIARSCAFSFGENKLSLDRWKYAVALEGAREQRNK